MLLSKGFENAYHIHIEQTYGTDVVTASVHTHNDRTSGDDAGEQDDGGLSFLLCDRNPFPFSRNDPIALKLRQRSRKRLGRQPQLRCNILKRQCQSHR